MRHRLLSFLSWTPVGIVISDKLFTLHYDAPGSLSPSIPSNSLVLVSRLHSTPLSRGDAVLVDDLSGRHRLLRRVIGLPGDYIRLREQGEQESKTKIVPQGFVWLQADGKEDARKRGEDVSDSDDFGAVPKALVTGKVLRVVNSGQDVSREPSDRVLQPAVRYS